jgi:di/tricarboxylate transporter
LRLPQPQPPVEDPVVGGVGAGGGSVVGGAGGVSLARAGGVQVQAEPLVGQRTPLRVDQVITMVVILAVAVGALVFDLEIGFLALIAAAVLHALFPERVKDADRRIVWSVVLLICGVVTFVGALQRYGTIDAVGSGIAGIGTPLLTAFLLCLVAAVTSAFASSAGLIGVLIPLAAPFLLQGEVGVTATIVAICISATVVDSTPFSSVGALTLANAPEDERPRLFRVMFAWGISMAVSAPMITWLLFILPSTL